MEISDLQKAEIGRKNPFGIYKSEQRAYEQALRVAGMVDYLKHMAVGVPGSLVCGNCQATNHAHRFGNGWCDYCLYNAGYLPVDHASEPVRIMFRPFFEMLVSAQQWELLQRFVAYFETHRKDIIDLKFTLDVAGMVSNAQTNGERCKECDLLLGPGSFSGFCAHKCYMRDYRRNNKEKVNEAQRARRAK